MTLNILVVEDSKSIQLTIKNMCKRINQSIHCFSADNTNDANKLLNDNNISFRAMILDNHLPAKKNGIPEHNQGLRFWEAYKNSHSILQMPVISSSSDDQSKFENQGFAAIARKPLRYETLNQIFIDLQIIPNTHNNMNCSNHANGAGDSKVTSSLVTGC